VKTEIAGSSLGYPAIIYGIGIAGAPKLRLAAADDLKQSWAGEPTTRCYFLGEAAAFASFFAPLSAVASMLVAVMV
jgi:hypothetical protein